ncbi:CHAD domain-containing protein, partial [Streptobacillus moniliformis]|uniref:CHAD domain-containing protein n=1 Tax=Streptobacillus moniliformis TaxID=34105 RepID=UPI0012DB1E1F
IFPSPRVKCASCGNNPVFGTSLASQSVMQVVKKLLLKRYHKMLATSRGIEFKKLRYLIEFFADLLPKRCTGKIVSEIKKIQTILGGYNDFCIQIAFLNRYVYDTRVEMPKALSG